MADTKRDSVRAKLLATFKHSGQPMATIYLPSEGATEDGAQRRDRRVSNVLKELAELGVSDEFESVVADALADDGQRDDRDDRDLAALALVATPSEVLLAHRSARPVTTTVAAVGRTPQLLPLLMANQADIEHLAVLLDPTGAEVWARDGTGDPVDTGAAGGGDPVHRRRPGWWAEPHAERIAADSWERGAESLVGAVLDASPSAEVVLAGGDTRAAGLLRDHLPPRLQPLLIVEEPDPADHAAFLDGVDTAIRRLAAEQLVADVRVLRDALDDGSGIRGHGVLELLALGRIGRLYAINDTFAPDRPMAGFDLSLPALPSGAGTPFVRTTAPITEGAVALAAVSGADVVVLPATGAAGVDGTVAGILRD
jgi:hypothetical protein